MAKRSSGDVWRGLLQAAAAEARRRGDARIGTDHLLLAVLAETGGEAAGALSVDLDTARRTLADLDRAALATVGLQELPSAPTAEDTGSRRPMPPLTSAARTVLKRAIDRARPVRGRRIDETDVLLALLALRPPDPAAVLLAALHVDAASTRAALGLPEEGGVT